MSRCAICGDMCCAGNAEELEAKDKRIAELKKALAGSCEENRQNWNQELRGSAPCPIGEKITEQEKYIAQLEAFNEKAEATYRDQLNAAIEVTAKRIEELQSVANGIIKDSLTTIKRYKKALKSIAANSCCDKCQEAALVAEEALRGE